MSKRYDTFQKFKKTAIETLMECSNIDTKNNESIDVAFQYMEWLADEFIGKLLPGKIDSAVKIHKYLTDNEHTSKGNRMGEMHGDRYAYLIPTTRKGVKAFHYEDQNSEYLFILQERFSSQRLHIRAIKNSKDFDKLVKNNFQSFAVREGNNEVNYDKCSEIFRYGDCRDSGYIISGEKTYSVEFINKIVEGKNLTPEAIKELEEMSEGRVERSLINFHEIKYTFSQLDTMMYYVEHPDELE